MAELSHWRDIVVVQKNPRTGCIPTGYEWLIKYQGVYRGINWDTFQKDFDLGRSNSFVAVRCEIQKKYPHIEIEIKDDFKNGSEKVEYAKNLVEEDVPCLIVLPKRKDNRIEGHIVPVVYIDNSKMKGVIFATNIRSQKICEVTINEIVHRHDNLKGGQDIAWLIKPLIRTEYQNNIEEDHWKQESSRQYSIDQSVQQA